MVFSAIACTVLYYFIQNLAILGLPMKYRPRPPEQVKLLRPCLVGMIDQQHELMKLAALIEWEVFDLEWESSFRPARGDPRRRRFGWWGCFICSTLTGCRTRRWLPAEYRTRINSTSPVAR